MALPATVTVNGDVVAGPWKAPNGNYYWWSGQKQTVGGNQGFHKTSNLDGGSVTAVQNATHAETGGYLRAMGFIDGDFIHVIVQGVQSNGTSVNLRFLRLDTSNDSLPQNVLILNGASNQDPTDRGCFCVKRSNGNLVAFFNGARVSSMGTAYPRTYYSESTNNGTSWGTPVLVDAGGTLYWYAQAALLGASNRVHFAYTQGSTGYVRTLTSANALQTVVTTNVSGNISLGTTLDASGTIKVIFGDYYGSFSYFDSADVPTISQNTTNTGHSTPPIMFASGTRFYAVYGNGTFNPNDDVYVRYSDDYGATWSTGVLHRDTTLRIMFLSNGGLNPFAHMPVPYTNASGQSVLPMMYYSASGWLYDEYSLSTPSLLFNSRPQQHILVR